MDWPVYKRTRIAPTPSGFLHLGNLLSFAWTAYLAKQTGARLLLRIDDLDSPRIRPEYVQDIFNTLEWMGIEWDEGPQSMYDFKNTFSQKLRLGYYNELLKQCEEKKLLFACSCSRKDQTSVQTTPCSEPACQDLSLQENLVNWRMQTKELSAVSLKDFYNNVSMQPVPEEMGGFIVRRKNQMPSYQLASIADDLYFDVDLVVRGQDLWASSIAQASLASAASWQQFGQTHFVHHPLLKDEHGHKLSKSSGARSVSLMRLQGITRQELYHYLSQLSGCNGAADDLNSLGELLCMNPHFTLPKAV
jgi:glutamyl/glutaminyl-tRNA synthetase